ncbi:MAG: hypothetical protein ACR2LF_12105 [Jatrophihabitantaceae bacterium]
MTYSRQSMHDNGTVSLAGVHATPRASTSGLTRAPGEHYILTDPDHNSVFSPGGPNAGSARLPGARGAHAVSPNAGSGTVGFVGITGPAQAAVNHGGDLEPPDQGLCSDGSTILEFVNNALEAYTPSGQVLAGPLAATTVFGVSPSTFLSDPRCYYDAPSKRWFLTEFVVGTTTSSGAEKTPSTQYVAVSNNSNPLGSYHLYSIDTTDSTVSGCPCLGDFDQIGADANGFYISTNEFGISSGAYNGAIIYAIGKRALEQSGLGAPAPRMITYRLLNDAFGQPYHVAPSQTPPGSPFAPNREYFVESNSNAPSDSNLLVYTLQGTNLLGRGGVPFLSSTEVSSEAYAFPPNANQKAGPIPLGDTVGEPEGTLQADFNAIQEVTYAGGKLYAELDTAAAGGLDGIGWFILQPTQTGQTSSVSIVKQGYLTAPNTNLLYPDIAVNAAGRGYMVFSLAGTNNYPSAADVPFGANGPVGNIQIAGRGAAPEDGFTCYAAFVGPFYGGCRWGDYSMGVAAGDRIFMATEYIPPTSRDFYTNWGTYVWSAPRR